MKIILSSYIFSVSRYFSVRVFYSTLKNNSVFMGGPSPDANMQGKRGLSKIQEDTSVISLSNVFRNSESHILVCERTWTGGTYVPYYVVKRIWWGTYTGMIGLSDASGLHYMIYGKAIQREQDLETSIWAFFRIFSLNFICQPIDKRDEEGEQWKFNRD